jgi:NADH-quinone oxidoreductase subunit M
VLLMFAHGLSIAALFLLSDAVYQRTRTHDFGAMGGLCQKAPVLAGFFAAAILAGAGLPGFANFWGEFSIFVALWKYAPVMTVFAALGLIISAIYGLRAVSRIFFGESSPAFRPLFDGVVKDIQPRERWPVVLLLGASVVVGFWPSTFSRGIDEALPLVFQNTPPAGSAVALAPANSAPAAPVAQLASSR